jgi:hypothetical protein
MAILFFFPITIGAGVVFALTLALVNVPRDWQPILAYLYFGAGLVLSYVLAAQMLRTRAVMLRSTGVELRDGHIQVFCPWEFFNTEGKVTAYDSSHIRLPYKEEAIALITEHRRGSLLARGWKVRTDFFYFDRNQALVMENSYKASIAEVGALLLELGRKLGTTAPSPQGDGESFPKRF